MQVKYIHNSNSSITLISFSLCCLRSLCCLPQRECCSFKIAELRWTYSKVALIIPTSWQPCLCVIQSPCGQDPWLMPTSRIQQRWWDGIYVVILHEFNFYLVSRLSLLTLSLAGFDDIDCHMGGLTLKGIEGGLWLTAAKQLRPSVQPPARNWILPKNHVTWETDPSHLNPRWNPSHDWHLDCSLVREPEADCPVKLGLDSKPTEIVRRLTCVVFCC